ncbi:MAG TPA: hypothetical protein VMI73_02320 [Trebonia sp.]|nr:hypothetical protein [Trebonia sp.]
MTHPDAGSGPTADGPLDDFDFRLLDDIQEMYQAVDPMPADLPERLRFRLSLRDLEIEMARFVDEELSAAAVRGAEQSRTITFDSESLTVMIRIEANSDGTVRIDGWLAPPQRREIEMKTTADPLNVTSDEQGRFAFTRVPRGTAQLIIRSTGRGQNEAGPSVVTPALIL